MAVERRQAKPQIQQSPPRRAPYSSYGDSKEPRPRSRSPVYGRDGRDGREHRDSRDGRDSAREARPAGHSRDHDYRYRSSEGRDKDPRGDPRADLRADPRGDPRGDPRADLRGDPRADPRGDPRADPRGDPRADLRGDPRADPRADPRGDPRADLRADLRGDPRADPRADPRDPAFREDLDRFYRSGSGAEEYYRRKDEPYRDPYRDPWNGRREPEAEDRARPEERRRNELYRQYYEELQRRYDTDRPVDCSVIVVNKAQNVYLCFENNCREYAETVGRKVRDLGMVVDLIFLNTEVSLTQALEDVGRARTPFAIIITQQHQVHRSCTVNILFGTPQEHRNMPMQDAMMLVAHNYDSYKVENREKEREEIARKAAKMADDVLLREPDRESHPISVLTGITLLSENRFVTPEELDSLIAYLKDKRVRLVRSSTDPLSAPVHAAAPADVPSSAVGLPSSSHSALAPQQTSHLGLSAAPSAPTNSSHQQELQAKILSLFTSGAGSSVSAGGLPSSVSQSQAYGSLGLPPSQGLPRPAMSAPPAAVSQGYGAPQGRMPVAPMGQRPPGSTSGINFDNPSVQKALDTLIQSGPSLNHLVGSGASQQPPVRPAQSMGQAPSMSMYPRHY